MTEVYHRVRAQFAVEIFNFLNFMVLVRGFPSSHLITFMFQVSCFLNEALFSRKTRPTMTGRSLHPKGVKGKCVKIHIKAVFCPNYVPFMPVICETSRETAGGTGSDLILERPQEITASSTLSQARIKSDQLLLIRYFLAHTEKQ